MKTIFLNSTRSILFMLMILGSFQVSAQISMIAPEPASNPNLGVSDPWTAICAGVGGFNQYYATISWVGAPNSDNEFILELSDASGDFTNAVELAKATDQNTNSSQSFDIEFSIPTDTRGNGYKMRARSTSLADSQESVDAYEMYYLDVTTSLHISPDGDGTTPGTVCSTTTMTLEVDNVTNASTYQYIWYNAGSPITGATGSTYTVTTSGTYFALVDYGTICTGSGNTQSNGVTVNIGSSSIGIGITPPAKTALCTAETELLSIDMTDPTWSYQWYKDGAALSGAIGTTYTVDASTAGFEGDYQIEISGAGICTELSTAVTITNADAFTVTRNNSENVVVLPSISETLSVSTTATSPTYQWYRNNTIISGATNTTLDITQDGTYYVAVTQTGGTCPGTIKNSENTVAVAPVSFEVVIDYASAYTSCANTSMVLEVNTINAIDGGGGRTDVTTSLIDSFTYQWQKDGANVTGETAKNISLTNTTENGDYSVTSTLNTYNESSNTLAVRLLTSETVAINSTGLVYCNTTDTITISTTTDLSTESFSWERDGTSINTTDATLNITAPGTYRLVLDKDGCSLLSNEIDISTLDPALIQLDVDGDIIFPEGSSRTVTATGGTQYRWFDANNTLMNSTDSMNFTEEGTFLLIANINNCEISIPLNVIYLDLFNIPNVITPNGDGANDQWVVPNSYSNKQDVTVTIYNDRGIELLNETNYQNNWPQSTLSFPKQNMVFYYVIKNPSEVLKQGTITVIK